MWGQTIFPGSPPFKSYVYICCIIYLFCIIPSFLHRVSQEKVIPFSPKSKGLCYDAEWLE